MNIEVAVKDMMISRLIVSKYLHGIKNNGMF